MYNIKTINGILSVFVLYDTFLSSNFSEEGKSKLVLRLGLELPIIAKEAGFVLDLTGSTTYQA